MPKKLLVTTHLSDKHKRMLRDDSYFDVTPDDVRSLLLRIRQLNYPHDVVVAMRIKYDVFIDDAEKALMLKYGLDYENHYISRNPMDANIKLSNCISSSCANFYINGYTVSQWRMLTDDDFFPGQGAVTKFINLCRENGLDDAVAILTDKYGSKYQENAEEILAAHNLPLNTKFSSISWQRIDGMSFYRWKLLYDESFVPTNKSALLSAIRQLNESGNSKDASFIENRFQNFLYPQKENPITVDEMNEAELKFIEMFPNNKALREKSKYQVEQKILP